MYTGCGNSTGMRPDKLYTLNAVTVEAWVQFTRKSRSKQHPCDTNLTESCHHWSNLALPDNGDPGALSANLEMLIR